MFIEEKSTVHDFKRKLGREFGFEDTAINIYHKYKLIRNEVYVR